MRCRDFEDRVSAYLEEELGADMRATMEQHAVVCTSCAEALSQTEALTGRLSQLPRCRPSAGFDFALRSRLLMEASKATRWADRLEAFLRPAFPRFALAGATVALVVLGAASVLVNDQPVPNHLPAPQMVSAPAAGIRPETVARRGALKLKALSANSYTISERYYRARADSVKASVKHLPAGTSTGTRVRPLAVRF